MNPSTHTRKRKVRGNATSPTPMHLSIKATSLSTLPRRVGVGTRYAPVHIRVVKPDAAIPESFCSSPSRERLTLTGNTTIIPHSQQSTNWKQCVCTCPPLHWHWHCHPHTQ